MQPENAEVYKIMVKRTNRTIEAIVSPELKQEFAYYCRVHEQKQGQAAGEAIRLFLDYKNHNFQQLQDHENSPLWVKLNQILEQEELNGRNTHELIQTIAQLVNVLLGGSGKLRESDANE